jgi:hypothetical protein
MLGPVADRSQGLSVHGSALPASPASPAPPEPPASPQTAAKGSPPTTASSCSASRLSLPGSAV